MCSEEVNVKQVPECCHALANRKTPTGKPLQQPLSVMVTSRVLQNSSALSGRTLRQSGRFNAEPCPSTSVQPKYRKPALSRKSQAPALPPEDEGQEVMGTSCSGRMKDFGDRARGANNRRRSAYVQYTTQTQI